MTKLARLICIMFAGAVALPSAAAARDQPAVHYVALVSACPDALKVLPESLYPAWLVLDSAAEVVVDFKLDGDKVSGVTMSGGHGSYIGPVRRAVKAMKCRRPGAEAYAVRFRITFRYPEDQVAPMTALQFADEAPRMAVLHSGQ